jgi:hypothetical protein
LHIVGNFGDDDHICPAGNARAQRQPAGIASHDFDQDDAVVAVGGAVQPVDGFGGVPRAVSKPMVTSVIWQVVIDAFGQGDHVQPVLL